MGNLEGRRSHGKGGECLKGKSIDMLLMWMTEPELSQRESEPEKEDNA